MFALTSLPIELIHIIVSYAPAFEIELLARTFNRKLYHICIPFLTKRLAVQRNANRMIDRFGPLVRVAGPCQGEGWYSEHPPNLDYLDLNGDLYWLQPRNGKDWDAFSVEVDTEDIVETAKRLHLSLPETFSRFMRSDVLRSRIPAEFMVFDLGRGGLLKCPASIDQGAGGYIVRFISDAATGSGYWSLYLDSEGGHCVLMSTDDPDYDEDEDEEFNIFARELITSEEWELDRLAREDKEITTLHPEDVTLVGIDFEEFLVDMYYPVMKWAADEYDSEVPPEVDEYFSRQVEF